jgi:outer membrane lipoprotein carrier protein
MLKYVTFCWKRYSDLASPSAKWGRGALGAEPIVIIIASEGLFPSVKLRSKSLIRSISRFALLVFLQPALAQPTADRVEHFFNEVQTLDANFTQQVIGENGEQVAESSGNVQLMRPGRFRWEYEKPERQLILADGEKLWIYDPELEQATVKSVKGALGAAPIALLIGSQPLEDQFRVEQGKSQDGLQWVELIPKVQDIEFNRIKLGLGKDGINRMVLHDQFGQTTLIRLQDVRINQKIDPARFEFDPPEGTDVIDAAG